MKAKKLFASLSLILALTSCASQSPKTTDETKEDVKTEESASKESKEDSNIEEISGTYEGSAKGYGGDIKVKVTLDKGEITDIETEESETKSVGSAGIERVKEEIIAKNSTDVDRTTGATISSAAFISAVNEALLTAGIDSDKLVAKEIEDDFKTPIETDVVVVGSGGAGLSAAIQLAQDGKNVTVVEKAGITGGNSSLASGGMNASETKLQEKEGIPDTNELFFEDTMKGGHDINNPDLVRKMVDSSSEAIDWLEDNGAPLTQLKFSGGQSEMRTHAPVNDEGKSIPVGSYLVDKLTTKAKELGVDIIYDARVKEILMEDGKAKGVLAETNKGNLTVNAKAVIVASGGFGANMDMVVEYKPELEGYVSTNAKSITGDAVNFLKEAGANFIDMDQIQIHPTVVQKDGSLISEGLRGEGAILLNQKGERFVDELETRDFVSKTILDQEGKAAYLLVDQKMMDESATIQKYYDKGLLEKAEDYKALAEIIGCDEETVKNTLEKWKEICANNEDPDFGRKGMDKSKSDLSKAPYYLVKIAPGIHHTMGGVEVNTNSEVISKESAPIPGLYAAGEVTGGVHGANRLGGNAVTDIVVFGRNAAKSAEEYIKENN
ncbi:MAG: flavocytochrome c [Anaerococcus sp.]|uniref:flavocytochrome c n=2 Tax=Anaerococcus sp. TaxID=1872515 RepID=UPI002635A95D|nr:flavocytochrome c [Anaerococcus sp.]MCI5972274.1 flavocytochrome c [Anaerococcus sp.]MDD6919521.1 flavocytochrome c [Peptoniphilaceae bacterium]